MAATDEEPKPMHGPEVEMVEKVGDNTPRDGDDNELRSVEVIPSSARENFSEKGRKILHVVPLRRT